MRTSRRRISVASTIVLLPSLHVTPICEGTRAMKHGRRDGNHQTIVALYRALGCSWADTADLGLGLPDGFVGCAGITDPVECKSENGKLEPMQETFMATWRGSRPWIVRGDADVIEHVSDMRRRARRL
jgi:hypothetical protein